MNSFIVVAKLVVGDSAIAKKPVLPALGCATVEATSTRCSNSQYAAYRKF